MLHNFNKRLLEFKDLQSKVTDKKIIFLAALKAEDDLIEKDIKNSLKKENINISNKKEINTDSLSQEIINLKDKINELESQNQVYKELNINICKELDNIDILMTNILNKIISNGKDK